MSQKRFRDLFDAPTLARACTDRSRHDDVLVIVAEVAVAVVCCLGVADQCAARRCCGLVPLSFMSLLLLPQSILLQVLLYWWQGCHSGSAVLGAAAAVWLYRLIVALTKPLAQGWVLKVAVGISAART